MTLSVLCMCSVAGSDPVVENVLCWLFIWYSVLPMCLLLLFRSEVKDETGSTAKLSRSLHHSLKITSRAGVRGILGHVASVGFLCHLLQGVVRISNLFTSITRPFN